MEDFENKSDKECIELLSSIFNNSKNLFNSIAPNGWRDSEYVKFLHPTSDQQLEEHIRISENIKSFSKKSESGEKPVKTLNDFVQDNLNKINEHEEFIYITGLSVYDIFSNNHEVIGNDNKIYDLGSFRGSGGFIADFINSNFPSSQHYDYIDFYMGSIWIKNRADLFPFYRFIFQKLKESGCNWKYSFPRLHIIDLRNSTDETDKHSDYDPEESMLKQIKKDEISKLKKELDESFEKAFEEAKYKPLSVLVKAYKDVYGVLPEGHPQKEFE